MMIFRVKFDIGYLNENHIYLCLTGRTLLKFNDFYLLYLYGNEKMDRILYVYYESDEKIEIAEKMIKEFLDLLTYLYGVDLSLSENYYVEQDSHLPEYKIIEGQIAKNKNVKKIYSVVNKIETLNQEDQRLIKKAIYYFAKGVRLLKLELFEENFLTMFKSLELITRYIVKVNYKTQIDNYIDKIVPNFLKEVFNEDYRDLSKDKDLYKNITRNIKNLITLRRIIVKALIFLRLDKEIEEVGHLVKTRNSIAAHGNLDMINIDVKDCIECSVLVNKCISLFLFPGKINATKIYARMDL